jgi:hypothetical protein
LKNCKGIVANPDRKNVFYQTIFRTGQDVNWCHSINFGTNCQVPSTGKDFYPLKASFHSGKLSVDWNGQENISLC